MDQDSFRSLLSGSGSTSQTTVESGPRGSPLINTSAKPKQIHASKPAFKPRKVKKTNEGKYRDRAAERREGEGNDYAHVESILEDFERQSAKNENKKAIEEQHRYTGGDVPTEGLDMALLEQNKARTTLSSAEDDEILENTYMKASTVPKKRTRTDILNELKQKRSELGRACDQVDSKNVAQSKDGGEILEEAKKQGKFKPIGFKPIGNSGEREKRKKFKSGDGTAKDGERKKKKHKVEAELPSTAEILTPMPTTSKANTGPEPESLGDDFDIFAGAGEYEGIDLGNDDDEEEGEVELELPTERGDTLLGLVSTVGSKGWFVTEDDEIETTSIPSGPIIQFSTSQGSGSQIPSAPPGGRPRDDRYGDGQTGEVSDAVRLQPLSSSALPSIRDFLAMDEAAEAAEKRRKRKEKKKNGGGSGGAGSKSVEEKVNRDYQRLQSYTSKREASGSRYHLSPYNSQFGK
ncbi:hypothetical protein Ac2012v2_003171 [Leucoagaricus gongylophorus]